MCMFFLDKVIRKKNIKSEPLTGCYFERILTINVTVLMQIQKL